MHSRHSAASGWSRRIDRLGAAASFLCAVHCALLPFALVLLPTLAASVFASHEVEQLFVVAASLLGLFSLGMGFRRHRDLRAFAIFVPAALLLLGGTLLLPETGFPHAALVVSGGSLLAFAHLSNLKLDRARSCALAAAASVG